MFEYLCLASNMKIEIFEAKHQVIFSNILSEPYMVEIF